MASLIVLYLNVIIFYNTAMSKSTKETTKYSSSTTTISKPKSIRTENEYKKIFLYVNNLNFVTNNFETFRPDYVIREEVYDGANGLVSVEIEMSLKRANSLGITDFLIPESSIDVNKLATIQVLEALVKLSFSYNITINMLLNQQFLIELNSDNYWLNNPIDLWSPQITLSREKKLILDPSNPRLKSIIEDRIRKLSKYKITNFYFGENPYYLIPKNNDLNKSEMVEFFDFSLLYERTKNILKISDKIKLFYYYNFRLEKYYENRFRTYIKHQIYEGRLICNVWDPFDITILSETFLSFIFHKSHKKKKVFLFYLKIINDSVDFLDVVLGIYLFSPVPIVLVLKTKYAFALYNIILTNQPLLPHGMYAKVNKAYLWVLKIMKENPFFQNNPTLLEDVKLKDGVISAISGTKENGNISGLLFLLYNRQSRNFNIDLNQRFPGWLFQTYSILYDSVQREKSYLLNQSGKIDLSRQQILIIQPDLLS